MFRVSILSRIARFKSYSCGFEFSTVSFIYPVTQKKRHSEHIHRIIAPEDNGPSEQICIVLFSPLK